VTDNVVQLPKPEKTRAIWVCNCGCTVMYCHADGHIECADCEVVGGGYDGAWRSRLPATPDEPAIMDPESFKVVRLDSAASFYRRRLTAEAEDVPAIAVVCIYPDGGLASYLNHEVESISWLRRKLQTVIRRMTANLRSIGHPE
jgi:hypothetical protein